MSGADLAQCRRLGRDGGLAACLGAVLDGLDPAAAGLQGLAAVPSAALPANSRTVPHRLAAGEGISLLRAGRVGAGRGLTGRRAAALAAVRIGVLERMLDLAVSHLSGRTFGASPIIEQQLVLGAVADVAAQIEALAAAPAGDDLAPAAAWARHERLTAAGWTVLQLFGACGYVADHPARSLHVSTLVADVWIGRG